MRADHLRPGDTIVLAGARVESVFSDSGSTYVIYADGRAPDVLPSDADLLVAREEEEA